MAGPADIDRLIEEGLTLYGQGELDRALMAWEEALAIDPDNEQAMSYVEYVRANYDVLTSDPGGDDEAPFGIGEDEPEYQIEISPGEVRPADISAGRAPLYMDPSDEGWSLEEETGAEGALAEGTQTIRSAPIVSRTLSEQGTFAEPRPPAMPRTESENLTLELEADEPPDDRDDARASAGDATFDSPTREYDAKANAAALAEQRAADTPAFELPVPLALPPDPSSSGVEFDSITSIHDRNRGFVKPTRPPVTTGGPPDLQISLRTPDEPQTTERQPEQVGERPSRNTADLLAGLPTPRPPARTTMRPSNEARLPASPSLPPSAASSTLPGTGPIAIGPSTRDYPTPTRTPASPSGQHDAIEARPATKSGQHPPLTPSSPTRDFGQQVTADLQLSDLQYQLAQSPPDVPDPMPAVVRPPAEEPRFESPLVSAPTRDLGLRARSSTPDQLPAKRPKPDSLRTPGRTPSHGEHLRDTEQTGVHQPLQRPPEPPPSDPEPLDPIDAMTRDILAHVDDTAPPSEGKDDRLRRRVMALFERAASWGRSGDLDRAAIAVELAMSEDPNSALAQKLIHRNRDTIMFVFQEFLGDMNRTPVLARPLHQLGNTPINPRAAFLLSRIDTMLSLEEILDVSGMPRLEALRYLCQLFLRGILR